jgi:hypothetical protein
MSLRHRSLSTMNPLRTRPEFGRCLCKCGAALSSVRSSGLVRISVINPFLFLVFKSAKQFFVVLFSFAYRICPNRGGKWKALMIHTSEKRCLSGAVIKSQSIVTRLCTRNVVAYDWLGETIMFTHSVHYTNQTHYARFQPGHVQNIVISPGSDERRST